MYARTKNGLLGMIINANADELINGPEIRVNEKIYCIERDSIKDIKENIIDLIEVGDIIEIYFPIKQKKRKIFVDEYFKDSMVLDGIIQKRIILKSIATKEQIAGIEYKI